MLKALGMSGSNSIVSPRIEVGDLDPGESRTLTADVAAPRGLRAGSIEFSIDVIEEMGFGLAEPVIAVVQTLEATTPELELAGVEIFDGESAMAQGNADGVVQAGEQIELRLQIANRGRGPAREGRARLAGGDPARIILDEATFGNLPPGAVKAASFSFVLPARISRSTLPFRLEIIDRDGNASSQDVNIDVGKLQTTRINLGLGTGAKKLRLARETIAVFPVHSVVVPGPSDIEMLGLNQLYASIFSEAGLRVVPQEQIRDRLRTVKVEGYEECFAEGCQIELGKALAATVVVQTSMTMLGSSCLATGTVYELRSETALVSASRKTGCDVESLSEALEGLAREMITR
jgi:hypothetical protein